MTDPQNWHSPNDDGRPAPAFGAQPPTGAWTPPPRPGLIPLRPLGFGTLLWAPFQVLRRNPKATFGSALLVQGAITLITLVVVGLVTFFALDRVASAPIEDRAQVEAGATLTIVLSALVPLALSVLASALLQGVIVVEVARATLGEKLRLGALWRSAGRRLWPLALWTCLLSAGLIVGIGVVAGAVAAFVMIGGGWVALAVVSGILGSLALLSLGAWLFTRTSLVPSLIVLERLGIGAAVRRSWSLTQGYFWRTLGVQFLVAAIVNIVAQVVSTPLSLLFGVAVSLVDPNAALDAYLPSVILYVLIIFVALVLGAVVSVVQSATTALIYIDLRMRKEGLDLELARFVESVPGSDVPDPYLVPTPAVSGPETVRA
ncbi:hypothetical protein E3T24_10945 [Cryobacterium sp. TmT2-59]|uniref:Glycerophosphoryl diester phosphodiesterase membrane domain-containing protein n=1 Tax=Cryobacterium shii TaxID=1259235 RepID=A0AAQ2C713_9MICO|nr:MULTISPECIES: hypothetical protein [Cryobacterium]TFC49791.1 hypothetical protein E3O49_05815 [Cryobacterium shii]TFC84020.1 hypothetical protein E3T24_10945 [Cryobacterium sp. TmT2-59]TFD16122.1 hypothetical protein E3T42_09675 [Cryobacterium sp. TMT4-10]